MYWNYGTWDGARSLHEMFDVQDKTILDYVSDYKLNLIVPEEIKDFDKFKTERWSVLGNEEVNLLNICLKANLKITSGSGEGVGNKVCKGIIELQEMSRAEGKAEGQLLTLLALVRDGLLSLSVGAQRAGMTEKAFEELLTGN